MDINPLIAKLNEHKDELIEMIGISMGFRELTKSDLWLAKDLLEIEGVNGIPDNKVFDIISDRYDVTKEESIACIRRFINKEYKNNYKILNLIPKDIKFIDN